VGSEPEPPALDAGSHHALVEPGQRGIEFNPFSSEVRMSNASSLKARRQRQKNKKLLDAASKKAKRLAKQALAGPVVKKEKVKKVKVKKEKVVTEKVKAAKPPKEESGKQAAKKSGASDDGKGAS
jgi:hypothetical protein